MKNAFKFILLGGAIQAPLNALAMISIGKLGQASVWCGVAFVESAIITGIDLHDQIEKSRLR